MLYMQSSFSLNWCNEEELYRVAYQKLEDIHKSTLADKTLSISIGYETSVGSPDPAVSTRSHELPSLPTVVHATDNNDDDQHPDDNVPDSSDGYGTDDTRPFPPYIRTRITRGTYVQLADWH